MKAALVTGASRGIGAATARELSRRGYAVVLHHHTGEVEAAALEAELSAGGGRAFLARANVADPTAVSAMFRAIDADVGPLDVVVCNAGITRDALLGASEPAELDALFAVNVAGVVHVCREAARRMVSQRRGSIVNVSSVAAQRPGRGQAGYAASKGAVESLTRALAVELAPRGIRVNAVAPGIIDTAMTKELQALAPDELKRRVLLRRLGTADEVARVIGFLASEDGSYVTGQVWNVDGGFKLE